MPAVWRMAGGLACAAIVTACGGGGDSRAGSAGSAAATTTLSPMAQVGKAIFFDPALSALGQAVVRVVP